MFATKCGSWFGKRFQKRWSCSSLNFSHGGIEEAAGRTCNPFQVLDLGENWQLVEYDGRVEYFMTLLRFNKHLID